jgi:acetyl esterase/lipase
MSSASKIPTTGTRSKLCSSISNFLKEHPELHLGGDEEFTTERRKHLEVFGFHHIPKNKQHSVGEVEFTALRGPHGTIPVRVFYPSSGEDERKKGESGALIYFHGGGYTVGSVDEFENGLRLLAEESGVQVSVVSESVDPHTYSQQHQVYGVDYRLAPEFKFPTQLDEYSALVDALQGDFGKARGVHTDRVCGGGDSAGGNMTAAVSLRRRDEGKKPLAGQVCTKFCMNSPRTS